MFVGWIRKHEFANDLEEFQKLQIIDMNLILRTFESNSDLCYGVYDKNTLVCFLTAYEFENMIFINNFYYIENIDKSIKKRVLQLFINNLPSEEKTVLTLVQKIEKEFFELFDFQEYAPFTQAFYKGGAHAFNFSNATAKSIANENYLPLVDSIDTRAFREKRIAYITQNIFKKSSLVLSTPTGYQHSYAIHNNMIKISPWIMEDAAYSDAEKLIRGVIYHRGLKRIIAFIPSTVKEITDLYRSYNFELRNDFHLMYINKKPNIDLEMIYAL